MYVRGGANPGLAPRLSDALTDRAQVLRLVGPLKASVRVVKRGDAIVASIGAPLNSYYTVVCGGQKRGHTPVFGVVVTRQVSCTLTAEDGKTMSFKLQAVSS